MPTNEQIEFFLSLLSRLVEAQERIAEQQSYIALAMDETNTRAREEGRRI